MKIIFKKEGKEIRILEDWKELGHPKSEMQWKDGRSSKEMARFALSDKFKDVITDVLKRCNIEEQDFVCEPEATTSLGPGFNPGCRNHDLLMIGKDCVIGIEAKVSESFDDEISKVLKEQESKYSNIAQTRAYKLIQYFRINNSIDYNSIGYQLFTSTRGTIYAAKDSKHCINLIIVFTGNIDTNNEKHFAENCKKNDKDYKDFRALIGATEQGSFLTKEGVSCWLKKIKVRITSTYEIEEFD